MSLPAPPPRLPAVADEQRFAAQATSRDVDSIADQGNFALTSGLNDFGWALTVLTSFPRAMLIMSGAFGLWRAGLISNALFAAGVAAVGLGVLGGRT